MVAAQVSFSPEQRLIIDGAFEIAERSVHQVLRPRRDVVVIESSTRCDDAVALLVTSGHSRAPVADRADLDAVVGVVHLRDLVSGSGTAKELAAPPLYFPEGARVLDVLRVMQQRRQQLAIVVDEHGGAEGIVTVEDLLEELVGEIYDETDRDVLNVRHDDDGTLIVSGRFPAHDLPDLGVQVPAGDYTTLAGAVINALGRIPEAPGDVVMIGDWEATVLAVDGHAITEVRLGREISESCGP